jgi:hypothetical protein
VGQEIDGHPGIIDTVLGFQVPARPINTDKIKTRFPIILCIEITKNSRQIYHILGETILYSTIRQVCRMFVV